MEWLTTAFSWYAYLFVLGIIFYPTARSLFPTFFDSGYAASKTIGILLLSYAMFVVGSIHLLPFTRISLFVLLVVFAIINFLILRKVRKKAAGKLSLRCVIFEELLFIASLLFLTFIRGQEPSLISLEKFMDFGFMNSILRSVHFPPLDMWYSADPTHAGGYPINYYYFGHLTGAVLIRFTSVVPAVGYNLILATILAQAVIMAFSLSVQGVYFFQSKVAKSKKIRSIRLMAYGLIGAYLANFAGNLHSIYLFTKGYPNDNPVPFWKIFSGFDPTHYWYPNATRFIPFTIHEFPSYSYVVADLHGHVFNIPFVLLMLMLLFNFFVTHKSSFTAKSQAFTLQNIKKLLTTNYLPAGRHGLLLTTSIFGFMIAVHYMTNAFDGPIYFLLTVVAAFALWGLTISTLVFTAAVFVFFILFSLPFSVHFHPFVGGIGVNCSAKFLNSLGRLGPFLFEADKCQVSPLWMLFVLWGFFFVSFLLFCAVLYLQRKTKKTSALARVDMFFFVLFAFSLGLLIIPEFFYIKDIYPAHFRANTMFKLGYQAYIMMSIAAAYTLYRIRTLTGRIKWLLKVIFIGLFFLVALYPFQSFTSYYGKLDKTPQLNGLHWLKEYPADYEIVNYLNNNVKGQPVTLEAQGDSYTQYERISAATGLPTVAGWWVHEWLWRGSADVVGSRIPDVVAIYESPDLTLTRQLIKKYHITYIVVSRLEREKYKNLKEDKFGQLGQRILTTSDGFGALYRAD